MTLEPIDPDTAVDMYLTDKQNELAAASIKAYKSRISHLVRWCEKQDIENLNTLTGRQLHQYRLWRRDEGDLNKVTEKTQMDTIRVFVRWLESIDAVEANLHQKVRSPTITPDENARDIMLDAGRAREVLEYLEKYEYGSIQHLTMALLWHSMMPVGGVHAIDVGDYNVSASFRRSKRGGRSLPIRLGVLTGSQKR